MYPISDTFKNAVKTGNAEWIVRADVKQKRTDVLTDLVVTGGTISIDANAAIRQRCDISIAATPDMIPAEPGDPLYPLGNELWVKAGFKFDDGTEELVPCGVYRISRPQVKDSGDSLTLKIDAYDRSRTVARARFTSPWNIQPNTPIENAIQDMIIRALPWLTEDDFLFVETGYTIPRMVLEVQDDPWKNITEMALATGCEVFFDDIGRPNLRQIPDPVHSAVDWEFLEGVGYTILEVGKDLDDEQAFNACVALGQSASSGAAPVRATVWDNNPASPTYFDPHYPGLASSYGIVPFFFESEFLNTKAQCERAAWANLRKRLGILDQVDFSAIPNPAMRGGDVVKVQRGRARIDSVNVVDTVTLNLALEGAMVCSTRQNRITE